MNFSKLKALVIGLGKSGVSSAEKLKSLGAAVSAIDSSNSSEINKVASYLESKGIKTSLGEHSFSCLSGIDLVIVSPGVPKNVPILKKARELNIPIWSEIELAYRLTDSKIIGVTGTNGKTTTTKLIGEILKQAHFPVVVAGNIGYPLVQAVDEARIDTFLVTELSSFQLETIVEFHPFISVLLNITEDHLDWHDDFEDYAKAKGRIFMNQTTDDFAVVNYDDETVRLVSSNIRASLIPTSKQVKIKNGVYISDSVIIAGFKEDSPICHVDELKIKGEHNWDNAMAAVGVSLAAGVSLTDVREVLIKFEGLKHRMEFVATIRGVTFYNDSKATNPDATVKALTAFNSPVILLLGGRNKGNSFEPIAGALEDKVKKVVVFGESEKEIIEALKNTTVKILPAKGMEEAVRIAYTEAVSGDVVLLSPACASFDMFSNYKERGEVFKRAVLVLRERTDV